jgi:ADP-ribose pyrophosphatase
MIGYAAANQPRGAQTAMKKWKTLLKKTVLDHGRFLKVEEHKVELHDGRVIEDWPWLVLPDFVNVVAVTEDGLFPCFRQTKYAVQGSTLAPVGGYVEPGENPLDCARRELREEAGYESDEWRGLASLPVDSNRGAGTAHFFLATRARFVGHGESDDLEPQEALLLSREKLESALDRGEVKSLPWLAVFLLALRALDGTAPRRS